MNDDNRPIEQGTSPRRVNRRQARSPCTISRSLDILGDRWTLLIVRDMLFFKKSTYKEFLESPEKIPTNTLAARLKFLEACGVLDRALYQENPNRYRYTLTAAGRKLRPILLALRDWSAG